MPFFQERIERSYGAVQLPVVFQEENRGYRECCFIDFVLATLASTDSWKNDINSAWIKLSDPTDSVSFILETIDGVVTNYVPTAVPFVNEPNAFYTTIPWRDVLSSDGIGCYRLRLEFSIGGLPLQSLTWGNYELKQYTIENALSTARLRVLLNLNQEIEGINFTGSNVQDSIRFFGQIRKDKSPIVKENLIYGSRRVENVVSEIKPTWVMQTDPYTDEFLRRFEMLYLLSDNEMFISDYNAHTNSYRILDTPVIVVSESLDREPTAPISREDVLTCQFNDRVQNKRTHY